MIPGTLLAQFGAGETGLLIFVGLFAVVVVYAFRRKNQKMFREALHMPLDPDEAQPRTPRERETVNSAGTAGGAKGQEERS